MDEILEIADGRTGVWAKTIGTDGKSVMVLGPEDLNSRRLRIKARWWLVARMAPRKYGR